MTKILRLPSETVRPKESFHTSVGEAPNGFASASKGLNLIDEVASTIARHAEGSRDAPMAPAEEPSASSLKLKVLDDVLSTVSDNDPRMDTVLRDFLPAEKKVLLGRYRGLQKELLNKRGILVFLAGRELRQLEDLDFMDEVLREEPCRSLGHCGEDPKGETGAAENIGTDVTLVYPQLVAMHSLANKLQQNPTSPELERILSILKTAETSPHPLVAMRASEILQKYKDPEDRLRK